MNLVNLGDDRLKKMGDTLSYVFEGEEFFASRLNQMGRRLAGGLKSIGIGRGDHVVVSMPNSPEVFTCFQAIWRIGAVIVPVMFLICIEMRWPAGRPGKRAREMLPYCVCRWPIHSEWSL